MTTTTTAADKWNRHSGVLACATCGGHGTFHSMRRATVNDPYPESPCPDCDGQEHYPECEVCGFDQEVAGFDCLACDTVEQLLPSALAGIDAEAFTAAFKRALAAARAAA